MNRIIVFQNTFKERYKGSLIDSMPTNYFGRQEQLSIYKSLKKKLLEKKQELNKFNKGASYGQVQNELKMYDDSINLSNNSLSAMRQYGVKYDTILLCQNNWIDLQKSNMLYSYDTLQQRYFFLFRNGQAGIKSIVDSMQHFGSIIFLITILFLLNCKYIMKVNDERNIIDTALLFFLLLTIPLFRTVEEKEVDPTKPLLIFPNWYIPGYLSENTSAGEKTPENSLQKSSFPEDGLWIRNQLIRIDSSVNRLHSKVDNVNSLSKNFMDK